MSDTEKESSDMKTEEEWDMKEDHVTVRDGSFADSPAGSDSSEDTNMDTTPDGKKEQTHTDAKEESDMNTEEARLEETRSLGCNVRFSTADDLDEMMDIGTVDQQEQEAQMKEEEQNTSTDAEDRCSPALSKAVLVAEDNASEPDTDVKPTVVPQPTQDQEMKVPLDGMQSSSSPVSDVTASTVSVTEDHGYEGETDVKPTVLPPPTEDDQPEDVKVPLDAMQSSSSPVSEAATSTRSDNSSPAMLNGMKVVKLSIPRLDKERLRAASKSVRSSPSPPLVKVKDEPIDEEYEQALTSSASTATVKDEPNTAREDLRIGSVYSVTPAETQTMPPLQPATLHMSCFNCKKGLMKGQTAFQRKGSPALFCSTTCLTTSLTTAKGVKVCYSCQKVIFRPQDVILAPDTKGDMKEFCSQNCLTAFNYKKFSKSTSQKSLQQQQQQQPALQQQQSLCSMCMRCCVSKHEVILSGSVHKMCSDACFNRFRTVNNLSVAGCANCGSFCHSKPLMLKLEDCNTTLCNIECLKKYKEKTKTNLPCTMCRTSRPLADMVDNRNNDDSVNLFCSSSCVMAFMVQSVSSSGARLNCDNCGKNTVPSYHLAMSDTSIRNFCTLQCVMAFQEKFKASQKQVNVFTKLPTGSTQTQISAPQQSHPDVPKAPATLNCSHCARQMNFKPELIQIKDKMIFVCSVDCSQEFKKANNVMSLCEYCKMEKITKDSKKINFKDCFFCSDGCKLLYRHELAKSWGKHCHSCSYCHCVSKKLVTAQYGGSTEEFCSEECRSKYTMLFCHVAKCDTCGQKGKLKQSLPMLGEVKHFCDLKCLLQFCSDKVIAQGQVFKGTVQATPIIANVVSLAGATTGKPGASNRPVQKICVSDSQTKDSGRVSIHTEQAPPPPPPKILKNKALLCRPLVQNKGVSCKTQTAEVESQTDEVTPKILVLPVPVPVYVPVPMSMYSQCTPKPVGLPLPLPVPMFLPVTMNNAEHIVETIKEIKEKIPSDPFEAELILMAEMVAEQTGTNDKDERSKEKVTDKGKDKQEEITPEDHASTYSDELDTDDLASFLNNWEEPSSDAGLRSPGRPCSLEKLNPILDIPEAVPSEPYCEPPPSVPPPMDIEADFTVETLERMARLKAQQQRSPSPPPVASRRRQAPRKAREKKGRKSQRLTKAAETSSQKGAANKKIALDVPKLKSQYGVDAWKRWIRWRQTQPNLEKPRFGSRPMELKEDLLRCTTAELSYGLCCFISEVKRPNGELYSPDSLFYLCLGIQQYLFENGRVENIFMDRFYNKFSTEFTNMLKGFKPSVTSSGYIHSRVEEEFLWDCKQLGAYSPIVLLNTLLFFCCKFFGFTTVEQHRQLSFAHVMRCTKTNQNNTKTTFLRFYPPMSMNEPQTDPDSVPAKKRKEEETKEEILEMMENTDNPLRCPVRLYEFYLSKCSESVKQRTNLFYLHPERCCVPNSPLWFSSTPLDDTTMEAMLTRILTVRELHLKMKTGRGTQQPSDPPFIPDEEDEDSD
ncbi:zinc finger MYM-type protein 4 [Aulostomus maculatus]